MKILAISDLGSWEGLKSIFDKTKPDVVALAGDLISDGFAEFRASVFEKIPKFKQERKILMKRFGVTLSKTGSYCLNGNNFSVWADALDSLEDKYEASSEFEKIRKTIHTDKFYDFLRYAGKKSSVIVVKGDHDEDFKNEYNLELINSIRKCAEISGKLLNIDGMNFLGLGFNETHYFRVLRPLVKKYQNKVDVLVTHAEQERMPILSQFSPKLIIRGHFGSGKYYVNNIPSVFTADAYYSTINIGFNGIIDIIQYAKNHDKKITILEKGSCAPWFSNKSEFEIYSWLKPYSE
ncbi:MAG: metallophosphoesterase [Candidatus Micrarchaeota archaeon]